MTSFQKHTWFLSCYSALMAVHWVRVSFSRDGYEYRDKGSYKPSLCIATHRATRDQFGSGVIQSRLTANLNHTAQGSLGNRHYSPSHMSVVPCEDSYNPVELQLLIQGSFTTPLKCQSSTLSQSRSGCSCLSHVRNSPRQWLQNRKITLKPASTQISHRTIDLVEFFTAGLCEQLVTWSY